MQHHSCLDIKYMSQFHLPMCYHFPIIIFSQVCFAVTFYDVTNQDSKLFEFRKTYDCTNSHATKLCMYSYTIHLIYELLGPSHYHLHMVPPKFVQIWSVHILTTKIPLFSKSSFPHSTTNTIHSLLLSIASQTPPPTSSLSPLNFGIHHSGKVHVSIHLSSEMIHSTPSYIIILI